MEFVSDPGKYNLIVSFSDKERDLCLQLIEIAIENENERGAMIPSSDQLRLYRSNKFPNDYYIHFSFGYLSLGIAFLRNIYDSRALPLAYNKIEELIFEIDGLCGDDTIYH